MKTAAEGRELIRRVALAVVKLRSNVTEGSELSGTLSWEDWCQVDPKLSQITDIILTVESRLPLDSCGPADAMNVLTLAHQTSAVPVMYALRWNHELPDPMDWIIQPEVARE